MHVETLYLVMCSSCQSDSKPYLTQQARSGQEHRRLEGLDWIEVVHVGATNLHFNPFGRCAASARSVLPQKHGAASFPCSSQLRNHNVCFAIAAFGAGQRAAAAAHLSESRQPGAPCNHMQAAVQTGKLSWSRKESQIGSSCSQIPRRINCNCNSNNRTARHCSRIESMPALQPQQCCHSTAAHLF